MYSKDTSSTILIVDDHPMIRAGLSLLLSAQPDLVVCGECHEATAVLPSIESLHPDLIVIDISLENSSGLTLIQDIKKKHKAQKMLAYSMHDEELFAVRAIQAGAMGYVEKKAHPRETIEAIRKILQGHMAVSQRVTDSLMSNMAGGRSDSGRTPLETLSSRELEVFELFGRGLSIREIAQRLNRSTKTIESHRERMMTKLGVVSSVRLVRQAVEWVTEHDHLLRARQPGDKA